MTALPRFGQITVLSQNATRTYADKKQETSEMLPGRPRPDRVFLSEIGESAAPDEMDHHYLWDRRSVIFSNKETPDLDLWKAFLALHPVKKGIFRKKSVPGEEVFPWGTGWWADRAHEFLMERIQANKTAEAAPASKINYIY